MSIPRTAIPCLSVLGVAVLVGAWAPPKAEPGFDFWGTGKEGRFYNRLILDCETFTHAFGRNAAWGRWVMPLDKVEFSVKAAGPDADARLDIRCRAGIRCINKGHLSLTTDQISQHSIPFDKGRDAQRVVSRIDETRKSCGRRR